jgi:hypothetical protein
MDSARHAIERRIDLRLLSQLISYEVASTIMLATPSDSVLTLVS